METVYGMTGAPWLGTAFLAENPDMSGQLPDAFPLATRDLLVAAGGHVSGGSLLSRAFSLDDITSEGLTERLYDAILPRDEHTSSLLHVAFGGQENRQNHMVARYSAVLAELLAYRVMTGEALGAPYDEAARALTAALSQGLGQLWAKMSAHDEAVRLDDAPCAVSVAVCRVIQEAERVYDIDVFGAGEFRVYLLDETGMSPLWSSDTPLLAPGSESTLGGRRIRLERETPFALLILSESACSLNPAEQRALADAPGLAWRYRMRLEDQILRLVTASAKEDELGSRAGQFFTGRANGRSCASGAMTILGASFEVFRSACQGRFSDLENAIALLPDGYDPARVQAQPPCREVEYDFIRRSFRAYPRLREQTAEVLSACCLDKLKQTSEPAVLPEDGEEDDIRRLSHDYVVGVFRSFDCENDGDRAQISRNRQVMRTLLADHWVTLRPLLCEENDWDKTILEAHARSDRAYEACLRMNGRMAELLETRWATLDRVEAQLSRSLDVLRANRADYVYGRAGDDSFRNWMRGVDEALPALLGEAERHWLEDTEQYHTLLAAYTAEREALFELDTDPDTGIWRDDCARILDGTLSDEVWEDYLSRMASLDDTAAYGELLFTVRTVSEQTRALSDRVAARAAERRMLLAISGDPDWQLACMRGALCEDADWGAAAHAMVDESLRNEYRETVRHWQETRELLDRQRAVYDTYSAMYTAFVH